MVTRCEIVNTNYINGTRKILTPAPFGTMDGDAFVWYTENVGWGIYVYELGGLDSFRGTVRVEDCLIDLDSGNHNSGTAPNLALYGVEIRNGGRESKFLIQRNEIRGAGARGILTVDNHGTTEISSNKIEMPHWVSRREAGVRSTSATVILPAPAGLGPGPAPPLAQAYHLGYPDSGVAIHWNEFARPNPDQAGAVNITKNRISMTAQDSTGIVITGALFGSPPARPFPIVCTENNVDNAQGLSGMRLALIEGAYVADNTIAGAGQFGLSVGTPNVAGTETRGTRLNQIVENKLAGFNAAVAILRLRADAQDNTLSSKSFTAENVLFESGRNGNVVIGQGGKPID